MHISPSLWGHIQYIRALFRALAGDRRTSSVTHTYTHMQEDKFGDIQTVKTKSGKSRKGRYMGGGGAFEKERNPLQNFDSDW
jgi:hypothetical protein